MSNLTNRLLKTIDYTGIANKRRENFTYLHSFLNETNELDLVLNDVEVPMVYPYLKAGNNAIRDELIQNNIYTATYWLNVKDWVENTEAVENYLQENLMALPIDQRVKSIHCNIIKHLLL